MNIIKPSPYEKNRSIEDVLSKGLSKPKSLWTYIYELYCALGLRYIFWDSGPAILITFAVTLIWIKMFPLPEQHPYAALFALAPVFFLAAVSITEINERVRGLYAIKMTYKYTIQQITAFRVLCFSLLGAVFCTLISLYFSRSPVDYSLLKALSVSFCTLFLCAALTLVTLRLFNRVWIYGATALLWLGLGFVLGNVFGQVWDQFLARIPVAVILLITIIVFAFFLVEIKRHMKFHKREVVYYAGR
ncbi:hypothetical protein ACK8P5_04615 [Paenibacillus sp. EC2-1]|uniref:hypothetical protein n=1 Tax=Paenibacillus sp. EC2-1 TaxID=3388665 RepID=UPI003BEEB41F